MLAKDMRSTFYLRVFRKHLGMYLCGFGAEWLFASIFTYFVIFVLQHDPAMVARAEQPELDSAAALYGAVYRPVREKGSASPIFWR